LWSRVGREIARLAAAAQVMHFLSGLSLTL
jgi:hypothetical protein